MQQLAKPKQVFPAEPPMKMPSTSVYQLRRRAEAELAAQRGFPPSEQRVDADLSEQQQGPLIAKRKANQRIDFEAFDAHRANVEGILNAGHAYAANKNVLQYMAEQAQLQHSLGTAHAELRPARREDIQRRIHQLRALVASTSAEAQVAGGRAMGAQFQRGRNIGYRGPAPNPRRAFDTGYQPQRR